MKQSYSVAVSTKQQFNEAISHLLSSDSQTCLATLGFIHIKLRQFNLDYDTNAVMNDVYLRGVKFIENGGEIKNPFSWIKGTALNVIREMSRRQKKIIVNSSLLEVYLETTPVEPEPEGLFGKTEWAKLQSVLVELRPDEQNILSLRWAKGLSWKEVAQALSGDGQEVQEGTARKRGGRALERLSKKYEASEMTQTDS